MSKKGTEKNIQIPTPGSFCWNEKCSDYGQVNAGNLRKFGHTRKGRQRWQCKTCKQVVTETRGTVFHGKKHDEQTILDCFAMLADRNSLAAIHRIKGVKEETVSAWLLEAAPQMEQIEEVLLSDYELGRTQLDALWTYVGHKGEKGGGGNKPSAARFGAGRQSKSTRGYESAARSRKPKKKSRRS